MKLLSSILVSAALAALLQSFLPWWSAMFATFAVLALMPTFSAANTWLAGFASIALLWAGYALAIDLANEGLLSMRMAGLFGLPHPSLLIALTALVGGLAGGLAALCGRAFRILLTSSQKTRS
jgi:hypothetical protein